VANILVFYSEIPNSKRESCCNESPFVVILSPYIQILGSYLKLGPQFWDEFHWTVIDKKRSEDGLLTKPKLVTWKTGTCVV